MTKDTSFARLAAMASGNGAVGLLPSQIAHGGVCPSASVSPLSS